MLAIKLNEGKEKWYILPGGGQYSAGMLPQTAKREASGQEHRVNAKICSFVIEGGVAKAFTGLIWRFSVVTWEKQKMHRFMAVPVKFKLAGFIALNQLLLFTANFAAQP